MCSWKCSVTIWTNTVIITIITLASHWIRSAVEGNTHHVDVNDDPKDASIIIPKACGHVTLHGKGDQVINSKMERFSWTTLRARFSHTILIGEEDRAETAASRRTTPAYHMQGPGSLLVTERGRQKGARRFKGRSRGQRGGEVWGWLLPTGCEVRDSCQETQQPCSRLDFSISTSKTQRMNSCCLKPLRLCSVVTATAGP